MVAVIVFFLSSACSTRARLGGRHRGRHQRRREEPAGGAAAGTTLLLRRCGRAGGVASGLRPRRRPRGRMCSLFCLHCWTRRHFGRIPHDCQALPPSVFLPTRRERKTLCGSCFTAPVLPGIIFFTRPPPCPPKPHPFLQIFSIFKCHLRNPSALTSQLLLVSLCPCGACRQPGTRATRWTRIWPSRTPRLCSR